MFKIGDTIKIVHLTDEPYNSNYEGKIGVITKIETGPWGDIRIGGTWGSIYIYPKIDVFETLKKAEN